MRLHRLKNSNTIKLIAVFATILFLGACSSKTNEDSEELLKVAWGGPKNISSLPLIAQSQGYFKEEGLEIEQKAIQTGKIGMDALISGDLDIAVLVDPNIAFIKFQEGADIEVICSIQEKYDDAIVARTDQGIKTPKDLEGKKLGILYGTTSHIFASRFIEYYQLDKSKIEMVNLSPPAIQASVLNGDLAAGSIWQPFRYNISNRLDNVTQFNDPAIYKAYVILAVKKKFAQENQEAINRFLKALIKAENFVNNNTDESISILAKELNLEDSTLKAVWGEYTNRVIADNSLIDLIKEEGEWISRTQEGFIGKSLPNYEEAFNYSFLKNIDSTRVK